MSSAPPSRPHARAVRQLLLGLAPVLVVGIALLVVLALRLPGTQAPLAAADATARATVVQDRLDPAGRGVQVAFTDASGTDRTGLLVLRTALGVAADTPVTVQYDPSAADGSRVYADGDAAHGAVGDIVFGLVLVTLVVVVVAMLTGLRLLGRRQLAGRRTTEVTVTHLVVRRGLLVRSWLELVTPRGVRWLPVYWAPEVAHLQPDTRALVHGDPAADKLVLPVLAGQQVWPSGRLRRSEPRGEVRQAGTAPEAGDVGLGRQLRGDGVAVVLAPVLGLLWAYVDGSGAAGFGIATALAATVLLWAPQYLGSDPSATSR